MNVLAHHQLTEGAHQLPSLFHSWLHLMTTTPIGVFLVLFVVLLVTCEAALHEARA